ncbi:hypothetical protein HELRODRAFT_180007 [Helobdella robusta]|uniref:Apple domain-containing protein n=1 Tax=Helobdella robusta TaxID=6412 RepID=T1FFC2_HELRO|nr:hypothetical protein HELRODRAFT_180007 [Helobdella robusta]ESN94902.1 hypothetical protein HELRODRAFT_180007 [Helobdella robusta]
MFELLGVVNRQTLTYNLLKIYKSNETHIDETECLKLPKNLALGAYTYNSSAHVINSTMMLTSFFAVDGKNGVDDNFPHCSTTEPGFEPHWIGVDLGNKFLVKSVVLYAGLTNAGLDKPNNLNNFIVGVSNRSLDIYPPVRGQYALCGQYAHKVFSKEVVLMNCSSSTPPARYVILQQYSSPNGEVISVCELEIYGVPFGVQKKNILKHKPATSSSVFTERGISTQCGSFEASLIVDGFHDNQMYDCHCGHVSGTVGEPNWFMVNMQDMHYVDFILFTSRNSFPIRHRDDNFYIGFSNLLNYQPVRNQYPLCGQWSGEVPTGSKVLMKCNANLPSFSFLIAQQAVDAHDGMFTICELEAYSPLSRDSFVWKKKANILLTGFKVKSLKVRDVIECFLCCRQFGGCDSINFQAASKLCELNKHPNGYSRSLNSNANWAFYVVHYY